MIFFSFFFGLILGSFLNVCIHRIPLKKSIIFPSSQCPQCGAAIRYYDNLPLISYLLLSGRCRNCGGPISVRYPMVELITGLLTLSLAVRYDLTPSFAAFLAFSSSLVVISFIDLQYKIIPDVISLPGILVGLVASVFLGQIRWYESVIGMIEYANAMLMLEGDKMMLEATRLYQQAAAAKPLDAMERLDVEMAKIELEDE